MSIPAPLAAQLGEGARLVAQVANGRSLAAEGTNGPRAALLDLTHGTLRRYGRVQATVRELSRRGPPDRLVEALLWCALYALDSGRYAEYTVVDQAVRACALLERWPARGYVNGVLRSYLRERSSLEVRLCADPEARYQHPGWWIDVVKAAYPQDWEQVLAAGNERPPMVLRVNRRHAAPQAYAARLAAAGLAARLLGGEALLLERPVPVEKLPGFAAGDASVQDAGAQRAAHLLDLSDGQRVLDACAAPGGKSAHILELADASLMALDIDPVRCAKISAGLERLGLTACVRPADCTRPETWWDGKPFDRVLADVPCSSSGVARRHPDVKWLRRFGDLPGFASRQGAILDALWRVLAPGGRLLYVTCSVFPHENEGVVAPFVARAPGACRLPLADGQPSHWLPAPEHDGFYYALIEKQV